MSRFGGHETFHVREGWLPKALGLLDNNPDLFKDPLACDQLGVGRNMAKSIDHWLTVTGLLKKGERNKQPTITELGKLILKKDSYFLRPGTWWALHINLTSDDQHAFAWYWLFNRAYRDRFDRFRFTEGLNQDLFKSGERNRSITTLRKDISCVLSSYSLSMPPEPRDPEEGHSCPFQSLGLLTHLRETDTYLANRKRHKDLPAELVGYAFAVSELGTTSSKHVTMPLVLAYAGNGCPGKTLSLDIEDFTETLKQAEETLGSKTFHLEQSGGEQTIRFLKKKPIKWMEQYYKNLPK